MNLKKAIILSVLHNIVLVPEDVIEQLKPVSTLTVRLLVSTQGHNNPTGTYLREPLAIFFDTAISTLVKTAKSSGREVRAGCCRLG